MRKFMGYAVTALFATLAGLGVGFMLMGAQPPHAGWCSDIDQMTICVPDNGSGRPHIWEDGSARYPNGDVYDPELGKVVRVHLTTT